MKLPAALAVVAALLGAPAPATAKLVHFAHRHKGHHHGQDAAGGQPLPQAPPAAPPPTSGPPAPEGW